MKGTNPTSRPTGHDGNAPKAKVIIGVIHMAVLDPPLPEVKRLLTGLVRTFVADGGPTGYRRVDQPVDLWGADFRGRVGFPAGLLPRVLALLDEHGYDVEVVDLRKRPRRLAVEDETLRGLGPRGRALVEAVLREPLGRVEVTGPREAVEVCHLFCDAFARARIVFAVATVKQAVDLHKALEDRHGERVGLAMSGIRRKGPRLLVATFGSVPGDTAGKWDALLLPYEVESTGARAYGMAIRMGFPRIYACVPPNPPVDRLIGLRLEEIAGPVIMSLDKPEAAVNVVMVPTSHCAVADDRTALGRKRASYWRNRVRNETVADVARAVVAEDWGSLRRYGVEKQNVSKATSESTPRVAVLVESTEHGRELIALLSGWSLCAATSTDHEKALTNTAKGAATSTVGVQKIVTKCVATTTDDVERTATKGAATITDAAENIDSNTAEGALTPTDNFNKANTEKRPKTSHHELKAKRTNDKRTGAVSQTVIKTATINMKSAKKSQIRVNTTATNTDNDDTGPIIVTTTYAATHDIHVDVLVRATGTDSPLRVKGFPAPDVDKDHAALLIDFDDSGQLDAAEDTERRLHDYRRRGMIVVAAQVANKTTRPASAIPRAPR